MIAHLSHSPSATLFFMSSGSEGGQGPVELGWGKSPSINVHAYVDAALRSFNLAGRIMNGNVRDLGG